MNLTYNLNNILFLDIETVPEFENWRDISKETQELLIKRLNINEKKNLLLKNFITEQELGRIRKNNLYFSWIFY